MTKRAGRRAPQRMSLERETALRVKRAEADRAAVVRQEERETARVERVAARAALTIVDLDVAARRAVASRGRAATDELAAVRLGRDLGVSWDRIGQRLGKPGETLRRIYPAPVLVGAVVVERS